MFTRSSETSSLLKTLIDSIVKKPSSGRREINTDAEKAQNIEKNRKRIAKMKEMYSMFVKMEQENALDAKGEVKEDFAKQLDVVDAEEEKKET